MRTEAAIIREMANSPLDVQRKLMVELNQVKAARSQQVQDDRDTDIANAVIRDTLTPVIAHARTTTATDWLGDVVATSDGYDHAMRTEATLWFRKVSKEVKADRDEFAEQAMGVARRQSGKFGDSAEAAYHAFLETAARLHRQSAGDSPGQVDEEQSGNAESTVTDYDTDADQAPMWAEDWDGEADTGSQVGSGQHPGMPGADGSDVDPEPAFDEPSLAARRRATRKRAWTEDQSDITPGADRLMDLQLEAEEFFGATQGYSPGDPKREQVISWIADKLGDGSEFSQADVAIAVDYNYHNAVEAWQRASGQRSLASRRRATRKQGGKWYDEGFSRGQGYGGSGADAPSPLSGEMAGESIPEIFGSWDEATDEAMEDYESGYWDGVYDGQSETPDYGDGDDTTMGAWGSRKRATRKTAEAGWRDEGDGGWTFSASEGGIAAAVFQGSALEGDTAWSFDAFGFDTDVRQSGTGYATAEAAKQAAEAAFGFSIGPIGASRGRRSPKGSGANAPTTGARKTANGRIELDFSPNALRHGFEDTIGGVIADEIKGMEPGKVEVVVNGRSYTVYYDQDQAKGDMGGSVPGVSTGQFELVYGPLVGGKTLLTQRISPYGGSEGGRAFSWAAEQVGNALARNLIRSQSSKTGKRKTAAGIAQSPQDPGAENWRRGYYDGSAASQSNQVNDFSAHQARSNWDNYSAGWMAGWLDYQNLGHDRLREFTQDGYFDSAEVTGRKTAYNDVDIEMAEMADSANENDAAQRGRRPFNPAQDGAQVAAYVEGAIFNMTSVYDAVTQCGVDYGFAPDESAQGYGFDRAMEYKRQLEEEERRERE